MACMSGHSKWTGIKHKKAIVDARRGAQFTKLARGISVAAREGGGDPESNSTLWNAVQKAKDASMPKDNIERAIAKGTGAGADADAIETVLYEGYGPGGTALHAATFGAPEPAWSLAADIAAETHVRYLDRPFQRVLSVMPRR